MGQLCTSAYSVEYSILFSWKMEDIFFQNFGYRKDFFKHSIAAQNIASTILADKILHSS
jgi:hypothetical protein